MSCAERGAPGARSGFTLVEVLVSLVLSALIAGFIFTFITGEGRFVAFQAARQDALQNARTPLMLISSELRAASAEGLREGSASAIELMVPRVSGIVCSVAGSTATVEFPHLQADVFTINGGTTGLRVRSEATGSWLPGKSLPLAIASRADLQGVVPPACATLRPNADATSTIDVYNVTLASGYTPLAAAKPGDLAVLYDVVRYDMAASGGSTWLRRSYGMPSTSSQQPMAGPLSGTGFRIAYQRYNGAWTNVAPGTDSASLSEVRTVAVTVITTSAAAGKNTTVAPDSVTTTVSLRN